MLTRRPQLAAGLLGLFAAGSLIAGFLSDGVYHEDDLTHYLIARWCQHDWRYLIDCWGRPGFTIPYSAVAWIGSSMQGFQACRIFSTLISAATAWLAYCTARKLGFRYAWAAVPLLALQPLYTHLSFTTLTETPLAFYFALASYCLVTGRLTASAAVMALAPITRDEAVVVVGLWALALALRGARWWTYPLLGWGLIAHNLACWLYLSTWPALRWLQPAGADLYGQGTPLTFLPKLVLACGPVVVALAILGSRRLLRRRGTWVLAVAPFAWFAVETLVYMRGAYSSGGYARFLVPICPWLAVLAAGGLSMLLSRPLRDHRLAVLTACIAGLWCLCEIEWHWRVPVITTDCQPWALLGRICTGALCVLLAACAWALARQYSPIAMRRARFTALGGVVLVEMLGVVGFAPMRLTPTQAGIRESASVFNGMAGKSIPLVTLNRWIYYWTDTWTAWEGATDVRKALLWAKPGAFFAWDDRFCTEPVPNLSLAEMRQFPGWIMRWPVCLESTAPPPSVAIFQRQAVLQVSNEPTVPGGEP